MARQADGQMSIKEDAEGDIAAAAYAAEYADAVHVWGWNLIPVGGEWDGSSSSCPSKPPCLNISGFRVVADGVSVKQSRQNCYIGQNHPIH